MKKIIIISSVSLSIIIIGLLVWFYFSGGAVSPVGSRPSDNLLPFGSGGNADHALTAEQQFISDSDDTLMFDERGVPVSEIFRLSNVPVAGMVVFERGGRSVVRFVDRATGHIYETALPNASSPTPMVKTKITNTTLPKIYEAHFRPDGNAVLLRSLRNDSDVIENTSLVLTPPTSTSTDAVNSVSVANFRSDMGSIAVGAGDTLFYSLKNSGTISSSAFNNPAVRNIFTSAFTEWRVFAAGNNLALQTKASSNAAGFAYNLNVSNGSLTKTLGPLVALLIKPDNSGSRIFYSYNEGGFMRSAVINLQNRTVTEVSPATLADKCVWSRRSTGMVFCAVPVESIPSSEPDNWYQGRTSFYDRIWSFNINSEIAQVLAEPHTKYGLRLDVIEPQISSNEDYLIFINKSDLSLWALRLQ
jgi:hypothetical protein